MNVDLELECGFSLAVELRTAPDLSSGSPVSHAVVTADLGDLVEETFMRGVLAERLPPAPRRLHARIRPDFSTAPVVRELEIRVQDGNGSGEGEYIQRFRHGRWLRRCTSGIDQLREEGTVETGQTLYPVLLAGPLAGDEALVPPVLTPPRVFDQSLEEIGVRALGAGSLVPDRPILINERMTQEILEWTEAAGIHEIGGATLGKMIRLPRPLPGTETRIVTILSTSVVDPRHVSEPVRFTFNPQALAEADEIARLRNRGETVLTVFHSHGWGTGCGKCNQNESCVIPECREVSAQDYTLLESLFPGKATLMPIAGRKLGAPGQRPVLEVHAWRGGRMRPLRWQSYQD